MTKCWLVNPKDRPTFTELRNELVPLKRNQIFINKETIDIFYNGSNEPSASVEDRIQNAAVENAYKISGNSFTYGMERIWHNSLNL